MARKPGETYSADGGLTRRQLGLPSQWRTTGDVKFFLQKQLERAAAREIQPGMLNSMTQTAHKIIELIISGDAQRRSKDGPFICEDPPEQFDPDGMDAIETEYTEVETEQERKMREAAQNRGDERYHTDSGTIVALKPKPRG